LSVFDNTYEIHFKTMSTAHYLFLKICSGRIRSELADFLISSGADDKGYVFAAPYSTGGWLAGKIPVNQLDFVLKASVTDPPMLLAKIVTKKLKAGGIKTSEAPTTVRLNPVPKTEKVVPITEIISPRLSEIINVLNHESVNLFAEHLIKELGKKFKNNGSTESGAEVIYDFLKSCGIDKNGMFIEDGSGLSPLNAVKTRELVRLLVYMKNKGKYFPIIIPPCPMPVRMVLSKIFLKTLSSIHISKQKAVL